MSARAVSGTTTNSRGDHVYPRLLTGVFALLIWFPGFAAASPNIPAMYVQVAQEQKVPAKLFFAVILNESRSRTGQINRTLPWPWTINHRGTPHFFETREGAYRFANSLVEAGDHSFDVGLGQMNWRWHKDRFRDLWKAFDPYTNLTAAARHFREQYDRPECGTWELAVGCYHRPAQRPKDKKIASNYRLRVMRLWAKI